MIQIRFGEYYLASSNVALGRIGPVGLSLNGQELVEVTPLFLAAAAGVFPRGNGSEVLSFAVDRFFSSAEAAGLWLLAHRGQLAAQADLLITMGESGATLVDACLEEVRREEWRGSRVRVRYTFRGVEWDAPAPPDPEPTPTMNRRGTQAIASGATSVTVSFAALAGVPTVQCTVLMPTAGGDIIFAAVRADTITAEGFTADLSGPTPGTGYLLSYRAEY